MKQLIIILLLPLILFAVACDDQLTVDDLQDNIPEQLFEIKFRRGQFPDSNFIETYDTYIFSGAPTTNYSSAIICIFGRTATYAYRTLISFHLLNYLPETVTVKKAYLTFYVTGSFNDGSPMQVAIHRILGNTWGESETWNNFGVSEYESDPEAVRTIEYEEAGMFSVELPASLVQDWIENPQDNHGIMLKAHDETISNQYVEVTDKNGIINLRPLLTVYYSVHD